MTARLAFSSIDRAVQRDTGDDERDAEQFSRGRHLASTRTPITVALAGSNDSSNAKLARGRRAMASWS